MLRVDFTALGMAGLVGVVSAAVDDDADPDQFCRRPLYRRMRSRSADTERLSRPFRNVGVRVSDWGRRDHACAPGTLFGIVLVLVQFL